MATTFIQDTLEFSPILLRGALVTVEITLSALVLSSVLGLGWALLRVSRFTALSIASKVAVNFIRGIPILVILFYVYFVLPDIGIQLTAFQAGTIGLGIAYSAYMSEVFRAGIEAVDIGQIEAAQSIGMRRVTIMRRVILPQAFKIALPPYGNNLVMLLKDSSQTSAITVADLALQSKMIAASSFKNMTVFTLGAIGYLILSIPLIMVVSRLEKKMGVAESISIRDVHKAFGANKVLKGIWLDVALGEVVCIIGPSGLGSPTILRCINGLETIDAGEIPRGRAPSRPQRLENPLDPNARRDGVPAIQPVSAPDGHRERD